MKRLPRIAISIGDPAGVGAEIALKALCDGEFGAMAQWLVVGDSAVLRAAGRTTGIDPGSLPCTLIETGDLQADHELAFGQLRAEYGTAAIGYVRRAAEMCLQGKADAMVTAPLNKEAVTLAGRSFSGHTEYIAELTGATESRMLLVSEKLATVHVSTHIALERACHLDQHRIVRTIELGHEALKLMRQKPPRIAVCGLNPHAGEHGLFGKQDEDVIAPAIAQARASGIDCSGPHSPDTIFVRGARGEFDLIVAMYHDQGHIPMKLIDFEGTVNVSLGMPIIRTSVDHGTAFDIAGRNLADATNMKVAMRLAVRMAAGKLAVASTHSAAANNQAQLIWE
ncbi:MAG TPA: 4-hydroxythreonine-4-phosphate dehydrogenase PdxA [Terracidiphilus sp.]|jgi:4-hydroxythreonine-4-phosphate dehydrogenase|nr:4-hydroxythreonine-4-phosphate dehydrogenase PdxA [Terracidiphilus sp.]